jgi:hypothetical protein
MGWCDPASPATSTEKARRIPGRVITTSAATTGHEDVAGHR